MVSGTAAAQDITGMWKGEMYVDSLKLHLPYEISVSEDKGKYTGYSRVVFFKDGKQGGIEEPGIQDISIKLKGNEVIIEDAGFLEHNFSINPPKQVKKKDGTFFDCFRYRNGDDRHLEHQPYQALFVSNRNGNA